MRSFAAPNNVSILENIFCTLKYLDKLFEICIKKNIDFSLSQHFYFHFHKSTSNLVHSGWVEPFEIESEHIGISIDNWSKTKSALIIIIIITILRPFLLTFLNECTKSTLSDRGKAKSARLGHLITWLFYSSLRPHIHVVHTWSFFLAPTPFTGFKEEAAAP